MIGDFTMKNKELDPKCLSTEQEICLNAAGYFTPCCWFDADDARKEDNLIEGFFNPDLNIDKHDNPVDIIEGEYWNKFITILKTEPHLAPAKCWELCSCGKITDKYLEDPNFRIHL